MRRFLFVSGIFFLLSATVIVILMAFTVSIEPLSFALYSSDNSLLGASVASDGQWRFAPGKVPEKVAKAIITFEDKRFYFHPGIDLVSVYRSTCDNILAGRIVSGASTLTMQTARLLRGSQKRTYIQKIHESIIALLLELRYTKKDILSLYASLAPFGGNVVGIEAASWRYFNRAPESLTWAEAATLAVLPNQPSLVHLGANRDRLLEKRDSLLHSLCERGYFDRETLVLALQEQVPQKPYPLPQLAPHYLEYCKRSNAMSENQLAVVVSDINRDMQIQLTTLMQRWNGIFSLSKINNAAAIIIDTETGAILSYIGNVSAEKIGENVDVLQSLRSSGSLLKPFLFGAMLDSGDILPQQLLVDTPTRIGSYKPENNLHSFCGVVPASQALARSLNIPWVRSLRTYGIEPFLAVLRKSGITTLNRNADYYGLPLILGGGEITLAEIVQSYAALTRRALTTPDGSLCHADNGFPDSPLSPGAAWLTLDTLITGIRPDNEVMWRDYASARKIAWKTGTSFGNRDAWAVGTTPEYTVGVWIGNVTGEGRPELKSFVTAAPVLFDIFSHLDGSSWIPRPDAFLEDVIVCAHSGFAAGANCAETIICHKPRGAICGETCPYCELVPLTPDKKYRALAQDLTDEWNGYLPIMEKRFVLPPWIEPYYCDGSVRYESLPPWIASHYDDAAHELAIVFPQSGASVYIPVELTGENGQIVLEARHRDSNVTIYWDIDGTYYGSTRCYHQLVCRPGAGRHTVSVTDSSGRCVTSTFEVLSDTNSP